MALPLAGVVAMLASASSTADEGAARARLQEKLEDAGARIVARSSSRVSHAVVLLPPGASSSASALKQCITHEEMRALHGRLAGVRFVCEIEKRAKCSRRRVDDGDDDEKRRGDFFPSTHLFSVYNSQTTHRPVPLRTSSLRRG